MADSGTASDPAWTPILSADGIHYCSPRCGGGKFCKKADFDRATAAAAFICEELGRAGFKGFHPVVHENLGWHARASQGKADVREYYDRSGRDGKPPHVRGYTAWLTLTGQQFIVEAPTPSGALGSAVQDARTRIAHLQNDLAALGEDA